MENIKITDSFEIILNKTSDINKSIVNDSKSVYNKELQVLKDLSTKLSKIMISEKFSGKNGFLLYEFIHDDRNKDDYYISPKIYFTPESTIVYRVLNNGKYLECSPNAKLFIGKNNIVYCECSITKILEYVTLKEILDFLEKSLNKSYIEYNNISERLEFVNTITKSID